MYLKRRDYILRSKGLILYLLSGGTGAISDFIIFKTLVDRSIDPIVSNIFSTFCGIGVSFLLNSRYTFSAALKFKTLVRFFIVGILGLAFSSIYLNYLITGFAVDPSDAKLSALPLIAGMQYSVNKLWTFKKN
jgi:putative flippase GtrA